jgi:hypothetical protein
LKKLKQSLFSKLSLISDTLLNIKWLRWSAVQGVDRAVSKEGKQA